MLIGDLVGAEGVSPRRAGPIDPRLVFFRLPGASRDALLSEFASRLAAQGAVPDAGELLARILKRENDGCTGVGRGVAIPHCRLDGLDGEVVGFATAEMPVDFGAADRMPVDLVFLVASPTQAAAAHLQAVARVSRLLRVPGLVEALRQAGSAEELAEVLRGAEAAPVGGVAS
jgi:PTS system nitrogen regulatory IIA component